MIITKARQSGKKCNGFKGCGDNIYIGFEYYKLRGRKCLCKACADKFKGVTKQSANNGTQNDNTPLWYRAFKDRFNGYKTEVLNSKKEK